MILTLKMCEATWNWRLSKKVDIWLNVVVFVDGSFLKNLFLNYFSQKYFCM